MFALNKYKLSFWIIIVPILFYGFLPVLWFRKFFKISQMKFGFQKLTNLIYFVWFDFISKRDFWFLEPISVYFQNEIYSFRIWELLISQMQLLISRVKFLSRLKMEISKTTETFFRNQSETSRAFSTATPRTLYEVIENMLKEFFPWSKSVPVRTMLFRFCFLWTRDKSTYFASARNTQLRFGSHFSDL